VCVCSVKVCVVECVKVCVYVQDGKNVCECVSVSVSVSVSVVGHIILHTLHYTTLHYTGGSALRAAVHVPRRPREGASPHPGQEERPTELSKKRECSVAVQVCSV
jgi:hypothetical protein